MNSRGMMDKAEIKLLVENDDKLQWWAAILFAEISELVRNVGPAGYKVSEIFHLIEDKVKEFPMLVIQVKMEECKRKQEQDNADSQKADTARASEQQEVAERQHVVSDPDIKPSHQASWSSD